MHIWKDWIQICLKKSVDIALLSCVWQRHVVLYVLFGWRLWFDQNVFILVLWKFKIPIKLNYDPFLYNWLPFFVFEILNRDWQYTSLCSIYALIDRPKVVLLLFDWLDRHNKYDYVSFKYFLTSRSWQHKVVW